MSDSTGSFWETVGVEREKVKPLIQQFKAGEDKKLYDLLCVSPAESGAKALREALLEHIQDNTIQGERSTDRAITLAREKLSELETQGTSAMGTDLEQLFRERSGLFEDLMSKVPQGKTLNSLEVIKEKCLDCGDTIRFAVAIKTALTISGVKANIDELRNMSDKDILKIAKKNGRFNSLLLKVIRAAVTDEDGSGAESYMSGQLGVYLNDVAGSDTGGFKALRAILQISTEDEARMTLENTLFNAYQKLSSPGGMPGSANGEGIIRYVDSFIAAYARCTVPMGVEKRAVMGEYGDRRKAADLEQATINNPTCQDALVALRQLKRQSGTKGEEPFTFDEVVNCLKAAGKAYQAHTVNRLRFAQMPSGGGAEVRNVKKIAEGRSSPGKKKNGKTCNFCSKSGHLSDDCYVRKELTEVLGRSPTDDDKEEANQYFKEYAAEHKKSGQRWLPMATANGNGFITAELLKRKKAEKGDKKGDIDFPKNHNGSAKSNVNRIVHTFDIQGVIPRPAESLAKLPKTKS